SCSLARSIAEACAQGAVGDRRRRKALKIQESTTNRATPCQSLCGSHFLTTKAGAGDRRPAGLCRSTRRYGGRWCVIPASPIVQHPPKNRPAVQLTLRELC